MPVMFLTLKNISTAQGLVFPSLSVHCIGNNEAFYFAYKYSGRPVNNFFRTFWANA